MGENNDEANFVRHLRDDGAMGASGRREAMREMRTARCHTAHNGEGEGVSERITIVRVPGVDFQADSKASRVDAIAEFRKHAEAQKREAERWLAMAESDFSVFRCTGAYAQRNRVDL